MDRSVNGYKLGMVGLGRIKDDGRLGYTASTPTLSCYFTWENSPTNIRLEEGDFVLALPPAIDPKWRTTIYRFLSLKHRAYFYVEPNDLFARSQLYECYWFELLD